MKIKYFTLAALISLTPSIIFASDRLLTEGILEGNSSKRSRAQFQEMQKPSHKRLKYDYENLGKSHINNEIWLKNIEKDSTVKDLFIRKMAKAAREELDGSWDPHGYLGNYTIEDARTQPEVYPSSLLTEYLINKDLSIETRTQILQACIIETSYIWEEDKNLDLPYHLEDGEHIFGNKKFIKEYEPYLLPLFKATAPSLRSLICSQTLDELYRGKNLYRFEQLRKEVLDIFLAIDASNSSDELADFLFQPVIPFNVRLKFITKLFNERDFLDDSARLTLYQTLNKRYEEEGFPRQFEIIAHQLLEFSKPH